MKISSLAVFCGSKKGNNPLYSQHAVELGNFLAEKNIQLIYGGGKVGIMGILADAVLEKGGRVIGVIPNRLVEWEHQHENLTELMIVEDMHTRKKRLYELCDAALVLPGGFGTLDEFFEMLTWNQLAIHNKPIYILNTAGFFDHLVLHMKQLEKEGFLYETINERVITIDSPEKIADHLET
jgi:uncharacterized protein (TIGR00730 family)